MEIKKLTLVGKSDAVVSMILDILESNELFPKIEIFNNLNLPIIHNFDNKKFKIEFVDGLDSSEKLLLGVFKAENKSAIYESLNLELDKFIKIVHKSSQISSTTTLGYGNVMNCLVSIAGHTTLGNFVTVNRNSSIGHHTIIEDFCTIHPGVNIAGHVSLGKNTTVGMGTSIFDGIKIGSNTTIGGGSVVTKDLPDNVIAYGNPCKIIKYKS